MDSTKTFLLLKYRSIPLTLHKWRTSEVDFLSIEEKKVLSEFYHLSITELETLRENTVLGLRKYRFDR